MDQTARKKATGETRYAVIDSNSAGSTEQRHGATFKLPKSVLHGALKHLNPADKPGITSLANRSRHSQERVLQSVVVPSIKASPLKHSLAVIPSSTKASKKPPLAASTAVTAGGLGKGNKDLAETLDYGVPNIEIAANRTSQNVSAGVKGALRDSYAKKRGQSFKELMQFNLDQEF